MRLFDELFAKLIGKRKGDSPAGAPGVSTALPGGAGTAMPENLRPWEHATTPTTASGPPTTKVTLRKCPSCGGTGSRWTYEGGNRNSYLREPMRIACGPCDGTGLVPEPLYLVLTAEDVLPVNASHGGVACQLGLHDYVHVDKGLRIDDVCSSCGHTRAVAWGRL